jgi:hypothetical protein
MHGSLGNYWRSFNTSIDLDTAGLPAIAYIAWNLEDSLHYIKFAHYNGVEWDTSVVRYDLSGYDPYPTDKNPSLKFNAENVPYIAFHKVTQHDTILLAYFSDSIDKWIVDPIVDEPYSGAPVSLAFNSQDYPCIAHGFGPSLAYTWWDGTAWHTDHGIASIGWLELRIVLALDNNDRPHIIYRYWGRPYPYYCYKDDYWHMCGAVEVDTSDINAEGDVSLVFDDHNQPHIGYKTMEGADTIVVTIMKHAKGAISAVEEEPPEATTVGNMIHISPNPFRDKTQIKCNIANQHISEPVGSVSANQQLEIHIYDIAGRLVKSFSLLTAYSSLFTVVWDGTDSNGQPLSSGVYIVHIKIQEDKIINKALLLR